MARLLSYIFVTQPRLILISKFHNYGMMKTEAAVDRLSAIAQESRLNIYRLLVGHGQDGLCAGDIASKLSIPANTLSFHLKELSNAGLITSQKQGRSIIYHPRSSSMRELISFLTDDCS